jgi:tetratricopeptide (TPR) repeat protein
VTGFAFPPSSGRTRAKYPFAFAATTCDAQALEEKGIDAEGTGRHAEALKSFEQALKCKPGDDRLLKLSFLASCQMKSVGKARTYWKQLAANVQATLVQICMREGITRDDLDGSGADCDADALQNKGIAAAGAGQHALALQAFEQALECKPGDSRLTKLAFMESCSESDVMKARTYYEQLDAAAKTSLQQMCFRSGISHDALEGKLGNDGIANISCTPEAKILIDGKDTGQTTPAHLQIGAGKHKITLMVGQDRFTYPLTVRAGESTNFSKDLR